MDLLGQAGESIGVFEFLLFDARSCELGLDETEPNMRFLLIVRAKFHLGSYCRSYGLNQIVQSHVWKIGKKWKSPKICRGLVPRRAKYGSHCETRCMWKGKKNDLYRKMFCRSETDTHNSKRENRVKMT